MLDRLSGHAYYRFLDGFSGYNQIPIAPEDQEKTTFTCPFGTFAYRRMPFGIEVDKAKIDIISNLPPPSSVKGVRSFRAMPDSIEAFTTLKKELTSAPIIIAPDWSLPFEIMCDASDFAIGAVLGQKKNKLPHVIHYASRTLNDAQLNYSTTEKELLVVVFALEKFVLLVGSKVIVYSDHAALRYLLTKKDAKPRLIDGFSCCKSSIWRFEIRRDVKMLVTFEQNCVEEQGEAVLPLNETFPDENYMLSKSKNHGIYFVNYLACCS
ncbi:unnamed protein product [Prunus brigantina]